MRVGAVVAPSAIPSLVIDETNKNSPESGAPAPEELVEPQIVPQIAAAAVGAGDSHIPILVEPLQNPTETIMSNRPRRQCRQNVVYTDHDLDAIVEHHIQENARARKRKSLDLIDAQKKKGRGQKNTNGVITPTTSTSKTKTENSSHNNNNNAKGSVNGPSTSSANSNNINERQRQALLASIDHVEYNLKFMDVDRLNFEMQTRDEAHLNPDFRRTLVDEWVATSYDHEFHLKRLMELAVDPTQVHNDSIMHTIFVMRGLLNNNLLKLKVEELKKQLQQKPGSSSSFP